jgi:hypothetical protein
MRPLGQNVQMGVTELVDAYNGDAVYVEPKAVLGPSRRIGGRRALSPYSALDHDLTDQFRPFRFAPWLVRVVRQ